MKLSIAMMVKNEEKYLDQCLSSLKPIMEGIESELIIVDTGSEDRTVDIAKKYTDKVYFHEWNNNFASMRNKTIQYAKGEWILILDGDEIVSKPEGIIKFLKSKESKKFNTAMLTIKNITSEDDESSYVSFSIWRLFRNDGNFRYEGAIHEQPKFQGPICKIQSEIVHYGYLSTDKELMEYKFERNTKLLKAELEKDPENIYYWFQLSQSYGMYRDYKEALEANIKAYEIAKKNNINLKNRMYIYTHLALAYYWNKKYLELEKICLEAMELEDRFIDLHYFLGKAQKNLGKDQEAIKSYESYIKMLSTKSYLEDPSVANTTLGKYEYAYFDLYILYSKRDKIKEALKYAKKITIEKLLELVVPHIIKMSIHQGKYSQLGSYYFEKIQNGKEKIKTIFHDSLEKELLRLQDKEGKHEIIQVFSSGEDCYALLNKVRLHTIQNDKTIDDELLNKIKNIDFTTLPLYYADIIYFYMKNKYPFETNLYRIREYNFTAYINYLCEKYDNLSEIILEYLQNMKEDESIEHVRVRKVLEKVLLVLDKLDDEQFKYIWEKYIEDGTYYISKVYSQNVIDNELINDVKNDEEAFLIYMFLAKQYKNKNQLEYVRYLKKALKIYPNMKKGIELLMEELNNQVQQKKVTEEQREFDELREKFKENINILLKSNKIAEAKFMVDEYLKMVPDDLEMLALKSEILLKIM